MKNRGQIKIGTLTILLISHLINTLKYNIITKVMQRRSTLILWTHMKTNIYE